MNLRVPKIEYVIVGSAKRMGGELACRLASSGYRVTLVSTTPYDQRLNNASELAVSEFVAHIVLTSYKSLAKTLLSLGTHSDAITFVFMQSAQGRTPLASCFNTVIEPIAEFLEFEAPFKACNILMSSQLSHLVGLEKSMAYHFEKAALESIFRFHSVRTSSPSRRFNVIRLAHLLTNSTQEKYLSDTVGKLRNLPNGSIDPPSLQDLVKATVFLSESEGSNGIFLDLTQGGSFVSATSERSGFTS